MFLCISPSSTSSHKHTHRVDDLHSQGSRLLSLERNTLLLAKAAATSWAHSSLSFRSLSYSSFLYRTPFREDSAFYSESQAGVIGQQDTGECRTACVLKYCFQHLETIRLLCLFSCFKQNTYRRQKFFSDVFYEPLPSTMLQVLKSYPVLWETVLAMWDNAWWRSISCVFVCYESVTCRISSFYFPTVWLWFKRCAVIVLLWSWGCDILYWVR